MTHRSLSTSSNVPNSATASAAMVVAELSNVAWETALVSAALDLATLATLLAGAIDIEQAPRPLSIFGLMRIGIGPSSSHTVGPIQAGRAFSRALAEAIHPGDVGDPNGECVSSAPGVGLLQPNRATVELYGSLSAIGCGHATDRAVIMGLAGYEPETVPAAVCESLVEGVRAASELVVDGVGPISFSPNANIHFLPGRVLPYHVNDMTLTAYCASGAGVLRRTYYSVGGDFVTEDVGAPGLPSIQALATASAAQVHATSVPFPFTASAAILAICEREGLSVPDIVLVDELSARSREEIMACLDRLCAVIRACTKAGMNAEGVLPGGLDVRRCAKALHERLYTQSAGSVAASIMADPLRGTDQVDLFAFAVNEENAVGRRVITTPTSDAAGIILAALVYYERFIPGTGNDDAHRFLLATTAMGGFIKTDASTAGAEVSYQGEVGSASPTTVADLAEALDETPAQVKNVVEVAMEHSLGPAYDPVDRLVQIPCIECNTVTTVKATNVARMTLWGEGQHAVNLDTVVGMMRQIGEDVLTKYKETSRGGLAVNAVEC